MDGRTARLENWIKDANFNIIWGNIYDDSKKRWVDGTPMHTSFIEGLGEMSPKEGDIITTLNSKYILGKPSSF